MSFADIESVTPHITTIDYRLLNIIIFKIKFENDMV